MITWQQLEQYVKSTVRVLKGGRREQAALAIAALCFSASFVLSDKVVPSFSDGRLIAGLQVALYVVGGVALVYGVVCAWRLVHPPELPPAKDHPSAIKGPMAFTEADGDLFRKLGRESELQKLMGLVLDDQVLMVVVRGASGAGKTSLLRAGLKHILRDRVSFHYWEGVPADTDKGLLRAIQDRWPAAVAKPTSLDELINPADSLGHEPHVIVLDQFEQMRGSRKIFQFLRRVLRESKPPHRITWVVAFRREFSAEWLDFISPEQERGVRPPQDVSLRLFTAEQAREVIGQLVNESNLRDSIEQSVVDNLVEAATVEGEVSPVDVGIGLLVLAELHERQSGKTITVRDYQFAGGAEGLLTQYISRCLELFAKEHHEAILKAMLALRDPEENRQRLAIGLTNEELAVEAGADARVLKTQLNRLAERDIRLLETDTPKNGSEVRYRLPHERLIPALYRLTGKLLAEVDQAKLKFQNAFQAWRSNDKHSRYLLKGKELRLVEGYETQIPWSHDEQEKKNFLFRSKRRRRLVRAATMAAALALIGVGWFSTLQYQRFENRRYLSESGYPPELYDFQYQLKKLEMTEPLNLQFFTWLSSDSVEELSLVATSSSNSIAGLSSLSKCHSLKKLTLNLHTSQVSDLSPVNQLKLPKLDLGEPYIVEPNDRIGDWQHLPPQLRNRTQLTLDFYSHVSNLEPLAELTNLTQLALFLEHSQVSNLEPLAKLNRLTQLRLVLNRNISDLEPLAKLSNLTELSLEFRGISRISNLEPLANLSNLKVLRLNLTGSLVTSLEPLAHLSNLTQLRLDLSGPMPVDVSNLEPLAKLSNLTQLSLNARDRGLSNLEPLSKLSNLTRLDLDLGGLNRLSNVEPLTKLTNLTALTLNVSTSQVSDLEPLAKLTNLTELGLGVGNTRVNNLEPLAKLINLTEVVLTVGNTQVSNLEPLTKLSNVKELGLVLDGANQVGNLEALARLSNLTELTLSLNGSSVYNLEPLRNVTSLRSLWIQSASRTQRMSLRNIPASLVELRF